MDIRLQKIGKEGKNAALEDLHGSFPEDGKQGLVFALGALSVTY